MAGVVPVYINFKSSPGKEAADKYGVTKVPTLIVADWEGKKIEVIDVEPESKAVAEKMAEIGQKHRREVPWAESLEKGIESAKKDGKRVAIVWEEKADDARALRDPLLWPLVKQIVWVRASKEDGKRLKLAKSPAILVLDAAAEKAEENPLLRIEGKRLAKEIEKPLKELLEKK